MGDITIKIPQDTNGSYEITDWDAAEKILRDLKKKSVKKRAPTVKKDKDFSELSRLMDEYRANPDAETVSAIKTAEKWRKRWDR